MSGSSPIPTAAGRLRYRPKLPETYARSIAGPPGPSEFTSERMPAKIAALARMRLAMSRSQRATRWLAESAIALPHLPSTRRWPGTRAVILPPRSIQPARNRASARAINPEPHSPRTRPPPITESSIAPFSGLMAAPSTAPRPARMPQRMPPPSNAGPALHAHASAKSPLPKTISPFVPRSTYKAVSAARENPARTAPARISPPTHPPAPGTVYTGAAAGPSQVRGVHGRKGQGARKRGYAANAGGILAQQEVDHGDIARHYVSLNVRGVEISSRLVDHRNHGPANGGRQFGQTALLRRDDARDDVGASRDLRIVGPGLAHDRAIGEADQ